jgi:hypothetical protein
MELLRIAVMILAVLVMLGGVAASLVFLSLLEVSDQAHIHSKFNDED